MDQDNKTEKATEKKRTEERKRGNVAKTPELNSAIILMISFMVLNLSGNKFIQNISNFMIKTFSFTSDLVLSFEYLKTLTYETLMIFLKTAGIFLICSALIGISSEIFQVKFVFSFEHLKHGFEKLNPITGIKKYFSLDYVVSFLKNIFKAAIVTFILYGIFKSNITEMVLLTGREPSYISEKTIYFTYQLGFRVALVMLVLAIFDYIYQRKRYEKKIMMDKYEVKMEMKQQEGDPLLKSRRRSKHFQLSKMRMMKELPEADVVITNPTMYAVALKYKPDFNAPRVVAKGMRLIAKKIKEIASENGIPVIENVIVAQTIYKNCEIGQEIPPELYKTVAEILAYVYKIKENFQEFGLI